jgi:Zn-dependent protease
MQERDPSEPDSAQPPTEPPAPPKKAGGLGAIAAAAVLVATKFKFLLIGLKFFTSSWTFLLSLVFYVAVFGWRIGIVLILVLAAHELGHYAAYRGYGLNARLPVFIPFLGAYTQGAIAPDLEQDAYIALAGPLTGLVLAAACYAIAIFTNDRFWYACADISAFLNLFNMIPVLPFDGGRVIGALWAPLWIGGVVVFVAAAAWLGVPIILVLLIALLGVPAMWATLRGRPDPRAATMTNSARIRVSLWYISTALALAYVLGQAHVALPSNQGAL